jgi:hypothetical protein
MFVTPIFVAKCLLQICVRHTFDCTLLLNNFLNQNLSTKKAPFPKSKYVCLGRLVKVYLHLLSHANVLITIDLKIWLKFGSWDKFRTSV